MPEPLPPDGRRRPRSAAERAEDHAAIDRLTDELLPSLMAKLAATGLGELEVREGAWRVRLRRQGDGRPGPTSSGGGRERRPGERSSADRGPERGERHHGERSRATQSGDASASRPDHRGVATSPAVGIYRPRTDLAVGDRVRTGDRIGAVDMLGVPQELLAPVDGIVGTSLVEPGTAVEYGQELIVIEPIPASPERGAPDVP